MSDARMPLQDVVVLDLTQMLAGPFSTMILADQGANVIKIEPPGGDKTRLTGPHPKGATSPEDGGYGAYFASVNRGKKSIVMDLKQPEDKALFIEMVKTADIVVENYREGVMDRLGLSYEALAAVNPRIVYGAIRGFGDTRTGGSPYGSWPAYDPIAQSMGGIVGITSPEVNGVPTKIGPGVGDIIPAIYLSSGLLSAYVSALKTGKGRFVDVSMVDSVLAVCERIVYQYSVAGINSRPDGNMHPLLCPFGIFKSRNGYFSLGIPRDNFWDEFLELSGLHELKDRQELTGNPNRVVNRTLVVEKINDWAKDKTNEELMNLFGGKIPFAPVYSAEEIFKDPHFSARNMLLEVDYPGLDSPVKVAGNPIKYNYPIGKKTERAPLIDENRNEILASFRKTREV